MKKYNVFRYSFEEAASAGLYTFLVIITTFVYFFAYACYLRGSSNAKDVLSYTFFLFLGMAIMSGLAISLAYFKRIKTYIVIDNQMLYIRTDKCIIENRDLQELINIDCSIDRVIRLSFDHQEDLKISGFAKFKYTSLRFFLEGMLQNMNGSDQSLVQ